MLAALPKAPSRYNPYKNKELAKFRRNLVIKNLYDNSYISKNKYEELINTQIVLKKRRRIFFPISQKDLEPIWKFKMDATTLVLFVLFLKAEVFPNQFRWTRF